MLSCPSWLWNHTGGLTCTAPGGCRTGGGHSSPQLPNFGGKRQLQVLKMPIRTPNRLSSVAGRSTTTYQCTGSCVGVSREFKQPVEAEVLFLVEFVHVLFPQQTFGVRSLLVQKFSVRFLMSVLIRNMDFAKRCSNVISSEYLFPTCGQTKH